VTTTTATRAPAVASVNARWGYLAICIICMVMIANLQYGWTLFVNPINKANGWSIASIQFAFAIFIALETWLTPIQGWIVDMLGPQRGPKIMIGFGGIMVGIGWVINAYAGSLTMLYLGAIVSGAGGGAVYATCVGMAVKWFPDRRGLAVGLTAAGYGAGAALTVIPIRIMIDSLGYADTFFWFGLGQGVVLLDDADRIGEGRNLPCGLGDRVRGHAGGRADAGVVHEDDLVLGRQGIDERRVPVVDVAAEVLQHQQRHLAGPAESPVGVGDAVGRPRELGRCRQCGDLCRSHFPVPFGFADQYDRSS